jgi:ribonuclease HI
MAILKCTEILVSVNVTRTRIHTYNDSRAAIAAVALVWECTQSLEVDSGSSKVTLERIPGHHRISGNEDSDKLGKEGINKFPSDHPVGIPFAAGKEVIRVT